MPAKGGQIAEKIAELVDKIRFLGATGDSVMLKKALLVTLFGIGAASITAPAFADVGLFFNRGGPGCLNSFSASISGASAGVRLPRGGAAY
jgi:hypothetical protein